MVCTKIESHRKGFKVTCDEQTFFLHPRKILEYRVEVGSDLDFHALQQESQELFAWDQALFYLSRGDKTGFQVKRNLKTKGYEDGVCDAVVAKLKTDKIVDDLNYALRYQEEKSKTHGQYYICQKLRERGISSEDINHLENLENPEEMATLLLRKYGEREVDYNMKGKMARFLHSRGFSAENTYKAVEIYENMQADDNY